MVQLQEHGLAQFQMAITVLQPEGTRACVVQATLQMRVVPCFFDLYRGLELGKARAETTAVEWLYIYWNLLNQAAPQLGSELSAVFKSSRRQHELMLPSLLRHCPDRVMRECPEWTSPLACGAASKLDGSKGPPPGKGFCFSLYIHV